MTDIDKLKKIYNDAHRIEVQVEEGGKLPFKSRQTDAGFDLYSTQDVKIFPGQVQKHPLNIRVKLPVGTYAEVTSKSGLGSKGLLIYAGIIDQEYRGIVHVIMSNVNVIHEVDPEGFPLMNTAPIEIKAGEKLAQLIMHSYNEGYYVEQVQDMNLDTSRGEGGFGSTGKQ